MQQPRLSSNSYSPLCHSYSRIFHHVGWMYHTTGSALLLAILVTLARRSADSERMHHGDKLKWQPPVALTFLSVSNRQMSWLDSTSSVLNSKRKSQRPGRQWCGKEKRHWGTREEAGSAWDKLDSLQELLSGLGSKWIWQRSFSPIKTAAEWTGNINNRVRAIILIFQGFACFLCFNDNDQDYLFRSICSRSEYDGRRNWNSEVLHHIFICPSHVVPAKRKRQRCRERQRDIETETERKRI